MTRKVVPRGKLLELVNAELARLLSKHRRNLWTESDCRINDTVLRLTQPGPEGQNWTMEPLTLGGPQVGPDCEEAALQAIETVAQRYNLAEE